MSIEISISGSVPRFSHREISSFIREVLLALDRLGRLKQEITEVSAAFINDEVMKGLNRKFRKKNRTTDVLTFPADDSLNDPAASGRPLGEILISVDQARRQALEEQHTLATEVRHLLLHGIIHALGYDHETDQGEMDALELELRKMVRLE